MAFKVEHNVEPWNQTFDVKEELQPHERMTQKRFEWNTWIVIGTMVLLIILSALWVVNR